MNRKPSTPAPPTRTGVQNWPAAALWAEGGARLAPHATPYTPQRLIPSQDIVRHTRVSRSLRPGASGTQKLLRAYGDALVCVRQRVSADGMTRMTTVELLVDVAPVRAKIKDRDIVGVQVKATEYTLRSQVRGAGGVWDADHRLWRLSYKAARALGLTARIVPLQIVQP